tara:strand:+ start:376 stop:507 length:132 start_codon:yes stop_codon:yes gene_type:complete
MKTQIPKSFIEKTKGKKKRDEILKNLNENDLATINKILITTLK